MKNLTPNNGPKTFPSEFSTDLAKSFNGRILAPHHPPCRCIRPSEIDNAGTIFDMLRDEEEELLEQGKQLWLVAYEDDKDHMLKPKIGFLITDAHMQQPTTDQLSRHANWIECLYWAASMAKHVDHELVRTV